MSRTGTKKDTSGYFKKLYASVADRLKPDPRARFRAMSAKSPAKFGNPEHMSPERHHEVAVKAGKARHANLSDVERATLMKLAHAGNRRIPKAKRAKAASMGGKALWANKTQEERAAFARMGSEARSRKRPWPWPTKTIIYNRTRRPKPSV